MNRIIKFRAWDSEKKVMHLVEGMRVFDPHLENEHGTLLVGKGITFVQNSIVWQQFTGIHDKNGKEVYEGDIVRVLYDEDFMGKDKDTNCEVRYEKKLAMFVLDDGSGLTPDCFETDAELTVVGNVFENPELAGRTE